MSVGPFFLFPSHEHPIVLEYFIEKTILSQLLYGAIIVTTPRYILGSISEFSILLHQSICLSLL